MVASSKGSIDSFSVDKFVNIRVGADVSWQISKNLSLYSFGVFQNEVKNPYTLTTFNLHYKPIKNWSIKFGYMATPSTEQRPLPVTPGGQFEGWTKSRIPGAALGVKTFVHLGESNGIGAGVASREKLPEYHVKAKAGRFEASGYYQEYNGNFGTALTYTSDKLFNLLVYNSDVVSNFLILDITDHVSIAVDTGFELESKNMVRGEWAILRKFDKKFLGGLIGVSYVYETRSVNGYLFVHL